MMNELSFMNRRTLLLAVAAGASGLAGCLDVANCPPRLHVFKSNESEAAASEQEVTPYQQLSEKRQQEFTRSLETENAEAAELDESADAWTSTRFVKYRGDYYETAVAVC